MIAYFDCFGGISGDMVLGALLDAGADIQVLEAVVVALGLTGEVRLEARHEERGHLGGTRALVEVGDGPSRSFSELSGAIMIAGLPDWVTSRSLDAIRRLGTAEAAIHGRPVDQVHLHELGDADTLVDVVGAFSLLDSLGVSEVHASPLPAPRGWIGDLPLPAPATLRVLAGTGAVLEPSEAGVELVTPTGAAILAAAPARFQRPALAIAAVGYGIGARERPGNALAVWLGPVTAMGSEVAVLEANLDDMPPTHVAALVEDLMAAGALDVSVAPILMKKGRPAHALTVIAEPDQAHRLARQLLHTSTTFGVRMSRTGRLLADRSLIAVETEVGTVQVKVKRLEGRVIDVAPEYEDCRALSQRSGWTLAEIMRIAKEAAWDRIHRVE